MAFKMDYNQVTEFPNIEPGVHKAIIHSLNPDKGPEGDTFLRTRFSITDDEQNRQAWLNLSLASGALWKVAGIMKRLGLASGEKEYKSRQEFETAIVEALTGQEVRITIYQEDFEGVTYDRVGKVDKPE